MADRIEALRIVTRCKSVDELVQAFEPFVDGETCFIPNKRGRPVGTEIAFSIRLADNTSVLRGAGVVRDHWTDDANPFGRPGIRIAITRIAPQSRAVYARLVPRPSRDTSSAVPIMRLMEKTERAEVAERGVKTIAMAPLDFAIVEEPPRRARPQRPPRATLKGTPPLTPPNVPVLVVDQNSSTAVAVAPLLWRWWLAVVAFALVVAMWLMR
jgi:hypothetical protein